MAVALAPLTGCLCLYLNLELRGLCKQPSPKTKTQLVQPNFYLNFRLSFLSSTPGAAPSLMVWGASLWGIVLASPMTGYFLLLCIQQHFPHCQCGGLWFLFELAAWANLLCLPLTSDVRGACSELRGRLLLKVATLFQGGEQSFGSGDQSVPFWYVQGLISWFTQAFGNAWFYLAMIGPLHWIRPYPSI